MKIGVDARALTRPITGIGRYTLEMCKILAGKSDITLYLYSPSPFTNSFMAQPNIIVRSGEFKSGLARQFWSETVLPLWVHQDKLDIFWGPAHCLPRFLPDKVTRVVTIHDLVWIYAKDTMRPVTHWLEKFHMPFAIKTADYIIADSHATAHAVKKEFDVSTNRLEVVTPGVTSIQRQAYENESGSASLEKDYFLFVGTLEPRKNLQRLLTAYSMLPSLLKDRAKLLIAGGPGWGNLELEQQITALDLNQHVRLVGYVDEHTLTMLYANAMFLAMPSLYEGFGLPLIEAMSLGTPVLTSNNSSMPEIAKGAALLVDPLDVQSIAEGLQKLIANNELRHALSHNAQQCAARYDWNTSGEQLLQVFAKAIAFRSKASAFLPII